MKIVVLHIIITIITHNSIFNKLLILITQPYSTIRRATINDDVLNVRVRLINDIENRFLYVVDGIITYRHDWNLWLYHCYKFNNINTLPSCSDSFYCQNSLGTYRVLKNNLNYLLYVSYGIIEGLTRILRILSQTFRSSPYSHRPSGRDHRDRTCDTPLPCCQDSPLSASPGLWCSDASSAKNEADSRTGYD